jgi:5-methylcytosine-specific restriction protein A
LITASIVPDHITPLARGGTDDDDNIRCLCGPCHHEVTTEQFGHAKTAEIGADGWPVEAPERPQKRVKNGGKPPFRRPSRALNG